MKLETIRRVTRAHKRVLGINRRNLDLVFPGYQPGKFRELDDKSIAKTKLTAAGIPVPTTHAIIGGYQELSCLEEMLKPHSEIVIKPANGYGGRGILVLERKGDCWITPSNGQYNLQELLQHVMDILAGTFSLEEAADEAILEQRVHPHPFASEFYPDGLADLRIVVENGKPIQAMCRLPTSLSDGKANLHGGGVGLGIDMRSGCSTAGICQGRSIDTHPDTGVQLAGLQMPHWDSCLELARRASGVVDVNYLGVDIVLDRDLGPLVLELNARPGLAIQLANNALQPVTTSTAYTRLDRFTFAFAAAMLALLAIVPLAFEHRPSKLEARTLHLPAATTIEAGTTDESSDVDVRTTLEWSSEAIPVSEVDEHFRKARAAIAAGDTTSALQHYITASKDSAIAPFALNNIALIRRSRGDLPGAQMALEEALRRYPDYDRGYYNLGLVLRDQHADTTALSAFLKAVALRPSHARSWAALGELYFDRRDFPAAVENFERAVQYRPDSRSYRLKLGLAHRLLGNYGAAVGRFAEVLALDANNEPAVYWWARSVLDAGESIAVTTDSIVTRLLPYTTGASRTLRCRSLLAMVRWAGGDPEAAAKSFQELAKKDYKRRLHTNANLAVAIQLGHWTETAESLKPIHADNSDFSVRAREQVRIGAELSTPLTQALMGTGDGLERLNFRTPILELVRRVLSGDREGAAHMLSRLDGEAPEVVEQARWWVGNTRSTWSEGDPEWVRAMQNPPVAMNPYDVLAHPATMHKSLQLWLVYRIAQARQEPRIASIAMQALEQFYPGYFPVRRERFFDAVAHGRTKLSKRLGKELHAIAPGDGDLLIKLAGVYAIEGEPTTARKLMTEMPESERQRMAARIIEARILFAEGKTQKSIRILRRLCRKSPEALDARVTLSELEFASGKHKKAIANLRVALDQAPGRLDMRRLLAKQLMRSKRYPEAASEWRRVLHLQSDDLSDRFNLALSLQRAKLHAEAVREYDEILQVEPDRAKAWFNRSLALEDLGRLGEAQKGYVRVLALDPEHRASKERLARHEAGPR